MAFSVSNVKKLSLLGDTPGLVMLIGDGDAASVTSGVLEGSAYGIRKILTFGAFITAGTGLSAIVKSYDHTTYDADVVTVTCTANDTFNWFLIGMDNGA